MKPIHLYLQDTRTKLLESKPQNPPFWLGLAIAYQLVNEPQNAVKVLNTHAESNVPVSKKLQCIKKK